MKRFICMTIAVVTVTSTLSACVSAPTGPTVAIMPREGKPFEVFQQDDEREQDHDLRNKYTDTAQSCNQAIDEQVTPPGLGQALVQPGCKLLETPFDTIHRKFCQPENTLE